MFVELHILQNFPPCCLNRDDTNAPKEAEFGGHRRARISSQCLKRAIRWHPAFAEFSRLPLGLRTKRLTALLTQRGLEAGWPEDLVSPVARALVEQLVGQVGNDGRSRALVYLGSEEVQRLGDLMLAHWPELSTAVNEAAPGVSRGRGQSGDLPTVARSLRDQFATGTLAPDIALFGRMIAENAHMNVEAACQVAHALSTHRLNMELDFFAAVDDLRSGPRGGAEMIGANEYYSACFYRYALVDVGQLIHNLAGERGLVPPVLAGFLEASVAALPSGRQHSSAAHSPPSFVLAVVRDGGAPWSLANAFETPIWVPDHDRRGMVGRSIQALDSYWGELMRMYGPEGLLCQPCCWLGSQEAPHLRAGREANWPAVRDRVVDHARRIRAAAAPDWTGPILGHPKSLRAARGRP